MFWWYPCSVSTVHHRGPPAPRQTPHPGPGGGRCCVWRVVTPGEGGGACSRKDNIVCSRGRGGPGFAPGRKSVPEGQTLSPSLAFGPRWLSWHVWPEVASGPGQRASPAGQAVYRTGRDQSLRGGRISLVPSPAGLLSCLSSRGNQSQPDLGNGREAVRTVGATLLGDRSV